MNEQVKAIFDFILDNWKELSIILLVIISLFISIFKKKTTITYDGLNDVLMALPGFINEAELSYPGQGDLKFKYVYAKAVSLLLEKYDNNTIKERGFLLVIKLAIENILSTPQKKEEKING